MLKSIEYSLTGYPENKFVIFRATVGKIASNVFSARGYMSHDLNVLFQMLLIPKNGDERKQCLDCIKQLKILRILTGVKNTFGYLGNYQRQNTIKHMLCT